MVSMGTPTRNHTTLPTEHEVKHFSTAGAVTVSPALHFDPVVPPSAVADFIIVFSLIELTLIEYLGLTEQERFLQQQY